jgi:hypothetical protein
MNRENKFIPFSAKHETTQTPGTSLHKDSDKMVHPGTHLAYIITVRNISRTDAKFRQVGHPLGRDVARPLGCNSCFSLDHGYLNESGSNT